MALEILLAVELHGSSAMGIQVFPIRIEA